MSTGLPVGTFIIRWVARLGCGGAEAGWDASRRLCVPKTVIRLDAVMELPKLAK